MESSCENDDWAAVIKGLANLDRILAMVDPELQKYIDTPPGGGKSVIYVAVNIKNGKAYVGKHGHGKDGQSFAASRKKDHEKPQDDRHTYFAYAMRKYGPESFEWYILWHGDASYENDMEVFLISPEGVHTRLKADNGWGYNLMKGGDGGEHSPETIQKIKAARNTTEFKAAASASGKARMDRETEEQKAERTRKQAATLTTAFEESIKDLPEWEQTRKRLKREIERRKSQRKKRVLDAGREFTGNKRLELREAMNLMHDGAFRDPDLPPHMPSMPTSPAAASSIASSSTDPISSSTNAQKRKADPWLESDSEDEY